jgi:hypothetical protein
MAIMPIHDWTRVKPGIFHHFHHEWISAIANALNSGILPSAYYALAEQITGTMGPDVLTLKGPGGRDIEGGGPDAGQRGVAVAARPPKAQFHDRTEMDQYAARAKSVVVHGSSDHEVIAVIEIVSPGNKRGRGALRGFVQKAQQLLASGVHLMVVDLIPPGRLDPKGIPALVWDDFRESEFELPKDRPLSIGSFVAGPVLEAFIEPTAVGLALVETALFLTAEEYVPVALEATYQTAWAAVPAVWRDVLKG